MLQRKRDRALELEEIRSKTRHVIKTFEGPAVHARPHSAFRNRIISLAVEQIGIAFPLTIQVNDGPAPLFKHDRGAVPAFLFSIVSLGFATQREESGNAEISNFAFQFVPM
jgi:protein CSF1